MANRNVEDVDLLVVGGGKAGKSLAMDRAKAGWKVAMVERDKIGGTCINVACIPTKALVGSARTLITARRAAEIGVDVGGEPSISLERLRAAQGVRRRRDGGRPREDVRRLGDGLRARHRPVHRRAHGRDP